MKGYSTRVMRLREAEEDAAKKAQQARAKKYGIGIKDGGNVTKPADYADVPDGKFADPVNYRYPLDPEARAVNAITRFNDSANKSKGGYTDGEWAKMGKRIAQANKGKIYKGGQVVDKSTKESLEGEPSLQDYIEMVCDAFCDEFMPEGPNGEMIPHDRWVREVYNDRLIVRWDDNCDYVVSYTVEGEAVTFAAATEWVKVERTYMPVIESLRIVGAVKAAGEAEPEGREWEVVIIGPDKPDDLVQEGAESYIRSKNGRLYKTSALEASVPLWNGIKVYDNHLTDAQLAANQGMRSVTNEWVGVIVNPVWEAASHAVKGVLKIVDDKLRTKLLNAEKAGVLEAIGLSIDAIGEGIETKVSGVLSPVVEKISKALSVDVVADPAAGGRLSRMIAGMGLSDQRPLQTKSVKEVEEMELEEIKKMVAEGVATALVPFRGEVKEMIDASQKGQKPDDGTGKKEPVNDPAADAAQAKLDETLKKMQELETAAAQRIRLNECADLLGRKLEESGLPDSVRSLVAKQFRGKTFEEKELDEAIKEMREALIADSQSGRLVMPDGAKFSVSPVTIGDQYELAFMKLIMGNSQFGKLATKENAAYHNVKSLERFVEAGKPALPRVVRLSEWYYDYTQDFGHDGLMHNQRLLEANVNALSVANIVKNALNLILAADYSVRLQWWAPVVRQEDVDTLDQATLVRVYGISNLSTMSEGDAYTEAAWADDSETASYVKRGNYIGITMETFLLDKLNVLRTIPNRLANAWYNTVSALVAGVFTVNSSAGAVLSDTGALFNSTAVTSAGGHANLTSTSLAYAAFVASRLQMIKQTDQKLGAGNRLLIEPKFMLVTPDLEATALQIRNSEKVAGAGVADINTINPYYQKFEVIKVPNWTSTTMWGLVADPEQFPAIWLIWLNGRRTPELFTADNEQNGAVFTNDEIRYKVRQFGYRFSSTYDCAPVSDFRPLARGNS